MCAEDAGDAVRLGCRLLSGSAVTRERYRITGTSTVIRLSGGVESRLI
jgi:hypothetical protein